MSIVGGQMNNIQPSCVAGQPLNQLTMHEWSHTFNFVFLFVLDTGTVSSTLLSIELLKLIVVFSWFMTLTESSLQSTFTEYFYVISTIKKHFYYRSNALS